MEVTGSLCDDQQLNETISWTVHKVLGELNTLHNRMSEVSKNCAKVSHRIDTISADVSGLKTEKAVVHTCVKSSPNKTVESDGKMIDTMDLYVAKVAEMDGILQNYSSQYSLPLVHHYLMQNEILSDDKTSLSVVPETIAQEPTNASKIIIKELDIPEVSKISKDISDVESAIGSPESEENGFADIRKELAARFASHKNVSARLNFTDESESENESRPEQNAQERTIAATKRMESNGMTGIRDQFSVKPVTPKTLFSDDSASDIEPILASNAHSDVLSAQPTSSSNLPGSVNCASEMMKESIDISGSGDVTPLSKCEQNRLPPVESATSRAANTDTNGFANIQSELAAKFARPKESKAIVNKNLFSDESDAEEQKDFACALPIAVSPDLSRISNINAKRNGSSNAPKKFNLLNDSDSDDDLFNRTAVSKTTTRMDLNRSINNVARKPTTVSNPVKSLLDSDTDDDPESLFQTKKSVSTSATQDVTPAKNILPHPELVGIVTKEKQPKKVISKSIFFDSDDSDDELFKPKDFKPVQKVETTTSTSKVQNNDLTDDSNSIVAKKPTKNLMKPEIEVLESENNWSQILKSRPKAPSSRRPRGSLSQKQVASTVTNIDQIDDPLS